MYHFISGYTAKVAGIEDGVNEPTAVFDVLFRRALPAVDPGRYADMLGERLEAHGTQVWLVNTGWTGGPHGVGHRMALRDTRALLGAVLGGQMDDVDFRRCECFGWDVPTSAPQVEAGLLDPRSTWSDPWPTTVRRTTWWPASTATSSRLPRGIPCRLGGSAGRAGGADRRL